MKKFFKGCFLVSSFLLTVLVLLVLFLPKYSPLPDEVDAAFHPAEAAFAEKESLNILLLGVDYNYDRKAQRYTTGARSDTILLLRVEPLGKELSMLSIPRDLMVGIGDNAIHGYDRINAAYSFGAEKMARETVERVTGLKIDHHIVVKSDVVADLVDTIGGVPINVEKQMDWDDNWAGLHIHLKPGEQVLSGEDAVGYCRFRRDAEGDFGRMRRQQKFVGALIKELKKIRSLTKFKELADVVQAKLKTDLSNEQLVGLAVIYKDFPLKNIKKGRPEVEDYFANGSAYLVLAPGEPHLTIRKLFPPLLDSSVRKVSVIIETTEDYVDEAKRVSEILRARGFRGVRIKRLREDPGGDSRLLFQGSNEDGAQVMRDIFPQLKLEREDSIRSPKARLILRSEVFVSEEA